MSNFLQRMVARAAIPHSGIKPTPQFNWPRVREPQPAPHSPGGEASAFANGLAPETPLAPTTDVQSGVEGAASPQYVPRRGTLTVGHFQENSQIYTPSSAFKSPMPLMPDSPTERGETISQARSASAIRTEGEIGTHLPASSETNLWLEPPSPARLVIDDAQPQTNPQAPLGHEQLFEREPVRTVVESPAINPRRREARDLEPPVEVKIGRVEVTFDSPPPPAPIRPPISRGFDDYAALRRYSPQAWNRWRG
jgi:hypothetical protein